MLSFQAHLSPSGTSPCAVWPRAVPAHRTLSTVQVNGCNEQTVLATVWHSGRLSDKLSSMRATPAVLPAACFPLVLECGFQNLRRAEWTENFFTLGPAPGNQRGYVWTCPYSSPSPTATSNHPLGQHPASREWSWQSLSLPCLEGTLFTRPGNVQGL